MQGKRNSLTPLEQQVATRAITKRLLHQPEFKHAQSIALYMSFNMEVSTQRILQHALSLHKSCYLPTLTPTRLLRFIKVDSESCLERNRFGILEPVKTNAVMKNASQFDLVLVPLVAFDAALHRLGMGGGYYDRTFALSGCLQRPCLVGLGYDFQRVNQLPHSNLDVSLDLVVTEKRLYKKPI